MAQIFAILPSPVDNFDVTVEFWTESPALWHQEVRESRMNWFFGSLILLGVFLTVVFLATVDDKLSEWKMPISTPPPQEQSPRMEYMDEAGTQSLLTAATRQEGTSDSFVMNVDPSPAE